MKCRLLALTITLLNITLSPVWTGQVWGQNALEAEIKTYIQQLQTSQDWQVRSQAAKALGKFSQNPNTIIPVLIDALEDEDEVVRLRATFSLMEIGLPVVPELIEALETENDSARASIEYALRRMGMEAAPTLSSALSSSDKQVRSSAVSIFKEMAADLTYSRC
ncbi:MAG: HEAT repeat domain-containing protein [Symploca sp. SIO2E6]|nr:HEAT repeat domain-containing protein [Symploca sp. SIO2E6]